MTRSVGSQYFTNSWLVSQNVLLLTPSPSFQKKSLNSETEVNCATYMFAKVTRGVNFKFKLKNFLENDSLIEIQNIVSVHGKVV